MTNTMHAGRAQTRRSENDEAQAVAAALGFGGLLTTFDDHCARRLVAVQPLFASAHESERGAVLGSHRASMPCLQRDLDDAGDGTRMERIARSLAQRGFRLRNSGDGWRIEPRLTYDTTHRRPICRR